MPDENMSPYGFVPHQSNPAVSGDLQPTARNGAIEQFYGVPAMNWSGVPDPVQRVRKAPARKKAAPKVSTETSN